MCSDITKLRNIILTGALGKKYGRNHQFSVSTPAEAIRALCANHPDFAKDIIDSEQKNIFYKVIVDQDVIGDVSEVHNPFSQTLRIVPVIGGGKKGFWGLIGGALLIGASFFLPGAALFGASFLPSLSSIAFGIGASLALGGVTQLLSPQKQNDQKEIQSFSFSGPINTAAQGLPVPVGYGRLIVGSAVISSGITTDNYTASDGTLSSNSYVRTLDLISEGEIKGLVTGDYKSIYLNKTPLQNTDGTLNFNGVSFELRYGQNNQNYIPNYPSIEREEAVNSLVDFSNPVTRTITDSTVNSVRVTMSTPALGDTDKNGNLIGTGVFFKIKTKPFGGSYSTVISTSFAGKTQSKYQRSYVVPLTGAAPWTIQIERVTADSTKQSLQNKIYFDSYTEIIDSKLAYPNSAIAGSLIGAEQFSSIPERAFHVDLKIIEVPTNYDPITRTYSGTWDGTFKNEWSNNPAWVFRDMVLNTRYGLGNYVASSLIDKWALYSIAQYCDGMVSDGRGGLEPRFTCNFYLQQQEEAFKVIQDLASVFRGMVYWSSGLITAIQDSPTTPTALFANANVIDGAFTYSGSSLDTRHSVALVSWNDPSDFYKLKPEYVEDPDAVARYGIVSTSIVAVGCTSRAQAQRVGKWLLYSEANETETVTFRTGLDGVVARPGHVIYVQDQDRAGVRLSGRILSATTSAITIDKAFTPSGGAAYTLSVMLPDGSVGVSIISNISSNVLTLQTALSQAPQADAVWMVSSSAVALQQFRVVSVIESDEGSYEITALKYIPAKYDFVESGIQFDEPEISLLNEPPDPVRNIIVSESLYNVPNGVNVLVQLSWDVSARANKYRVEYRVDGGNYTIVDNVTTNLFEITNAQAGNYDFNIYAVSYSGKRSFPSPKSQTINGKTLPPGNVQNFSLAGVTNGVAQLVWDRSVDLDVLTGGYIRIRHTPNIVSPDWSNAVDIGPALSGTATTATVPHIDGTYLAKFVDSSGFSSVAAAQIITTTASLVGLNAIATIDESAFAGTKTNTVYSEEIGGLILEGEGLFDSSEDFDAETDFDNYDDIYASGEYLFASHYDLGAVYTSILTAAITAQGISSSNLFDSDIDDFDSAELFDGDVVDDVNAALFVRTTNDNPAGSPTWSTWRQFFVGQYTARAFQFKLILTSINRTSNIAVTDLSISIDMPDRVESGSSIVSGAAEKIVTFPAGFRAVPSVGINAHNMNTGDYYEFSTAISANGFGIRFKNSAGTVVNRTFDYIAKGYGYAA